MDEVIRQRALELALENMDSLGGYSLDEAVSAVLKTAGRFARFIQTGAEADAPKAD